MPVKPHKAPNKAANPPALNYVACSFIISFDLLPIKPPATAPNKVDIPRVL